MFHLRRVLVSLLSVVLLLMAWIVAPASVAPRGVAAKGLPTLRLYIAAAQLNRLQPLDATSLASSPQAQGLKVGPWSTRFQRPMIVVSAGGDAFAAVTYGLGGSADRARDITIRTFNSFGERQGPVIHPAVLLWVEGLSAGGRELYGQGYRPASSGGSGTGFYVLDAFSGAVRYHLPAAEACCGSDLFDPATHRLYILNEPPNATAAALGTPVLKSYDVATGRQIGQLALPGLVAGSWTDSTASSSSDTPALTTWSPGFALSPDTHHIAILDSNRNALTMVNTVQLTIERTMTLSYPRSPLERLGDALGLTPTVAEAKEFKGVSLTMTYSPDGRSLLVSGFEGQPNAQGLYRATPLGLRRIDATSGEVQAQQPPNGMPWWLQYAPDGSALYTLGPVYPNSDSPLVLRRYDPLTLNVLASHEINQDGYYAPPTVLMAPDG